MVFAGNRVVITGMGVLAANGIGREAFWSSLVAGRSGVGPVTLFDASAFPCRIAGEVSDFDPLLVPGLTQKTARRMSRASQLAIAATHEALGDAGMTVDDLASECIVFCGTSTAAMDIRGMSPRPWSAVVGVPNGLVSAVVYTLGLNARMMTLSNGCASGLDSVVSACECVASGQSEVALAIAADSAIEPYTFECFVKSRKLSLMNDRPKESNRPFDSQSTGGVIAEGSGVVVVESLEHARARGVHIYGEIDGYGRRNDPPGGEEGGGIEEAMRQALRHACMSASRIDAVRAHAPGDPHMDSIEVAAVKSVLGARALEIPMHSIKGVTANPMGVGGMHQLQAGLLAMRDGLVPPTTNLECSASSCDLDHVPGSARRLDVGTYLINSHGFGRSNTSMVFSRLSERSR